LYGEMSDFDRFAARHVNELPRTAYLLVWDDHEAEDLVQECLFRVARRWPRVREIELPLAYARRILINLATDGARSRARRLVELEPPAAVIEAVVDPTTGWGRDGHRAHHRPRPS
jgi:DNA-directed RNA polymerase specialized sigma24 family protein